jgi:hypothetical protein
MKTATRIKDVSENLRGKGYLYLLSEPLTSQDEQDKPVEVFEHIIGSAVIVPMCGPETYLFPATPAGTILDLAELNGSFRGGLNTDKAMKNAGYEILPHELTDDDFSLKSFEPVATQKFKPGQLVSLCEHAPLLSSLFSEEYKFLGENTDFPVFDMKPKVGEALLLLDNIQLETTYNIVFVKVLHGTKVYNLGFSRSLTINFILQHVA